MSGAFFCKNICLYEKIVVILHHQTITNVTNYKTHKNMNKTYFTQSFGCITLNTATINRNFRIKINGIVNGKYVSKLVGVRGLLELLRGSWERLAKMVLRAFNSIEDKCVCKIYGGAQVTFYAK